MAARKKKSDKTMDETEAKAAEQAAGAEAETEAAEPEVVEAEVVEGEAVDEDAEPEAAPETDELAEAKKAAAAANDRYLRLQAEWDNFRKRTAQEREQEKVRASEKLVTDLLPVLDDMDRALSHAKEAGDAGVQIDGVEAVLNKFLSILAKSKVEPIEAMGEPFDANLHQAIGTQENQDVPEETVVQVYQKGYKMGDRILRPAMVVTSTK